MLAILVLPLMFLGWTAIAVVLSAGRASMANAGPHVSPMCFIHTPRKREQWLGVRRLTGNIPFYNIKPAVSRCSSAAFFMIHPAKAIAGSLPRKNCIPLDGTIFPTTGGLFVGLVSA